MTTRDVRRRLLLANAVAEQGGEWTTRRVQQLYRAAGLEVPLRRIWRDDLEQLTREGLLTRHDEDTNRRFYTCKDDAR